jgi:hypothetical protein
LKFLVKSEKTFQRSLKRLNVEKLVHNVLTFYRFNNHDEVLSHNQDASFVPKAIDLAARELTSLATPGQGISTILSWLLAPVS